MFSHFLTCAHVVVWLWPDWGWGGSSATTQQLLQEVSNTGEGREDTVMALIDAGADVNAMSLMKTRPLYEAVRNGFVESAKVLLDAEADVNATNTKVCECVSE